nr:fibrinogen C domain-containing protein 1-like isoform X2 [Procambarus clarkii]
MCWCRAWVLVVVWAGVVVGGPMSGSKAFFKHKSNSSMVTVPSDLLVQLLDVTRSLQKLLPSDLPVTLLDVTPEEAVARVGDEGHNSLLSLALRHHALLQQRNEELLTQHGRCTAQIEALQEDKQELRLQLLEVKRQLQQLQRSRGDPLPPPTGTVEGAKKSNKVIEEPMCPCKENITEAELEERNFVGEDCVCENVTVSPPPPPPTTPAPKLLGTGARVKDCAGHQSEGETESGMYEIYPSECRAVRVWCDLQTDGGGWTVFLNRQQQPKQVNFTRTWKEYRQGFGDVTAEYWLGNEYLHQLTAKAAHVLRVDAEDFNGSRRWGVWGRFRVEDEDHNYKLLAVMYSSNSTLGDGLLWHSGMQFSTIDKDNDKHKGSCAHEYKGGWWYNVCHNANPTGILTNSDDFDSVGWVYWSPRQYKWASLRWLQMKIRPQNFGTPDPSDGPGDCSGD